MTKRKKKIIFIQLIIFLTATMLIYNTYLSSDKNNEEVFEVDTQIRPDINSFTDIEYSGFDLRGNRYVLQSSKAEFKTATPEIINMTKVIANFYLEDGTQLVVISDKGIYNNITLNMEFTKNVKSNYLTNTLFSDRLIYSNSNAKLLVSGNVHGESIEKGEFFADNVEYDLTNKIFDFSMFEKKQVNIKIRK